MLHQPCKIDITLLKKNRGKDIFLLWENDASNDILKGKKMLKQSNNTYAHLEGERPHCYYTHLEVWVLNSCCHFGNSYFQDPPDLSLEDFLNMMLESFQDQSHRSSSFYQLSLEKYHSINNKEKGVAERNSK